MRALGTRGGVSERVAFVAVAENRYNGEKHGGAGSIIADLNNLGVAEEWQKPDQLS